MAPAVTREILLTYGGLALSAIGNGNGQYTLAAAPPSWVVNGGQIAFYNCANSLNNGVFTITGIAGNVITTSNAASVTDAAPVGLAALPVAGPSNFSHHDKYKFRSEYKTRTYTFDVVFAGATSYANFLIYCTQVEACFRTPRQRFRVSFSGTVFDDLNPVKEAGGNTGFNQAASIEKLGDDFDTSRSRGWRITVEAQLPADLAGQSGRQDSSVRVDYLPSRVRAVTISGRYTALGNSNARAQYNASIDAYAAAIQSANSITTWELVGEEATNDDADKNLDFSRRYEELIYDQSTAGRDDAAIKMGRYNYTRQQIAPGDSDPATRRLEIIDVEFECWIDVNVTTDLNGYWSNTLKSYLLNQAQSKFALGQMALVDHQYKIEHSQNRIFGRMQIQATGSNSSGLVQSRYTTKIATNNGKVLIGTWDGNPLSYHVYDGKAKLMRIRTWTKLLLGATGGGGAGASGTNGASMGASFGGGVQGGGSIQFSFMNGFSVGAMGMPATGANITALVQAALSDGPPPGGDDGGGPGAAGGVSGWVALSDEVSTTPITIGLDGNQINLTEVERQMVEQYVEAPRGGGGGGPAAGPGAVASPGTQ